MLKRTLTLKGEPISILGDLPEINTIAPNFTIVRKGGEELSLYDIKSKYKVLIFFPSIESQECSDYVREFHQQLLSLSAAPILLGVSRNEPSVLHTICSEREHNKIILGSDLKYKHVGQKYGIEMVSGPYAGYLARATLILDENNIIKYTEISEEVSNPPNYNKIVSYIRTQV